MRGRVILVISVERIEQRREREREREREEEEEINTDGQVDKRNSEVDIVAVAAAINLSLTG